MCVRREVGRYGIGWMGGKRVVDRAITLNSGLCVCAGSRKEEVVGCGGRTVPVIRSCVCVPV